MQRNFVRNVFFVVFSLLLVAGSLLAMRIVVRADQNQRSLLSGHTVPLIQQAHLLRAADATQQLNLSIGMQLRNSSDLDNLLSAVYNPQSPQYHQYLTSDQFNQLFAPTSDQVQQVVSYLQGQGLTVTSIAPNNLLIDATGTVAQVQQAFSVQINNYQAGNRTFYANAVPPSVPTSISQLITSIGGLDDSVQYQPLYRRLAGQMQSQHAKLATPSGFGPKDLSGAYDATPLQNSGMVGDNQTVALFELDGYQPSDITQYFQNYGLATPTISTVPVDGFNGTPGQGAIEVELDMEVVGAIAPHAKQIVYEGPNTTQGLNDTYNQIVNDKTNKPQIVSISWGLCEANTGTAELQTLDNIFKQGTSEGISFFAASGDSGAYDCGDGNLGVDSPAGDPNITGVGGTNLQLNGGAYGSESVWSNSSDTQRSPNGAGGGGGLSTTFAQPSWQTGTGVLNQYSNGKREVPDVSADADPATGYATYCTVTNAGCPSTGWITVGGTSAAAPLWAGCMALINQYLQSQGKAAVGLANPALYGLFNAQQQSPAFHDVTSGNNLYYPATTGYDMASGIGTPDVNNIAHDLALIPGGGGTPTPTPTSTPTPTPTSVPSPTPTPTSVPSPTPTTPPTPTPTPAPPPALMQNGGFEKGQAPWQESSSGGYQMVDNANVHSGQYSAYLCGYSGCNDRIWQTFTVPTNFTKITITYWWYSDTNKTTNQKLDTFTCRLQTTAGTLISTLQQSYNTSVTNAWVSEPFDVTNALSKYKGQQVTLFFQGTNVANQYQPTDFFIDDVAVNVT